MVKLEEAKLEELRLFDSQPQAEINRAAADVAVKEARIDLAAVALKECTLLAPADTRESVMVASLVAGNYTAIVRGNNGTTGVALVEVYRIE